MPRQAIQEKFTCSNNCSNSLTMAHNDSAVCTRLCNKSLGFCYTICELSWLLVSHVLGPLPWSPNCWHCLNIDIDASSGRDTSDTRAIIVYGIKFCAIKNSILSLIVGTRGVVTAIIFWPMPPRGRCSSVRGGWCDGHKTKRDNSWHLFCVTETLVLFSPAAVVSITLIY